MIAQTISPTMSNTSPKKSPSKATQPVRWLAFPGCYRAPRSPRNVGRTPGISCEAVPASVQAGAGMRRHLNGSHAGRPYAGAAESLVSFIPLFDAVLILSNAVNHTAQLTQLLSRSCRQSCDTRSATTNEHPVPVFEKGSLKVGIYSSAEGPTLAAAPNGFIGRNRKIGYQVEVAQGRLDTWPLSPQKRTDLLGVPRAHAGRGVREVVEGAALEDDTFVCRTALNRSQRVVQ